MLADAVERGGDGGGGAEEERARYAIDDDVPVGGERGIVRLAPTADRTVRNILLA